LRRLYVGNKQILPVGALIGEFGRWRRTNKAAKHARESLLQSLFVRRDPKDYPRPILHSKDDRATGAHCERGDGLECVTFGLCISGIGELTFELDALALVFELACRRRVRWRQEESMSPVHAIPGCDAVTEDGWTAHEPREK